MSRLVSMALSGTVMALLLLAVKQLAGKRLPSAFYYYAWVLVLLRFVLPIPGLIPTEVTPVQEPQSIVSHEKHDLPARPDFPTVSQAETLPTVQSVPTVQHRSPDIRPMQVLIALWAVGALGCLGRYLYSYAVFLRRLHTMPAYYREWKVYNQLKGSRFPRLCRSAWVQTPMMVGVLRPLVVLPNRIYRQEILENILNHELTHYRRRDIAVKWFAMTVYSLYWFHPLMPVIRRQLERECELSCDEFLLKRMTRQQRQSYGETLLALAASRTVPSRVAAATLISEKESLKERLEQIMTYRKRTISGGISALLVLTLLCGCGAALGPQTTVQTAAPIQVTEEPAQETTEETAPPSYPDDAREVTVSNADEFLAAIAPNRIIYMESGNYDLSQTRNYGILGGDWYHWEAVFDGYELVISDVTDLEIQGAGKGDVTISVESRYANVLRFRNCAGLYLSDFTAGHTEAPGLCVGGVIFLEGCEDAELFRCGLYGCGVRGVEALECRNVHVRQTEIYDCSVGAFYLCRSDTVLFENCKFHDCSVFTGLFEITGCRETAVINSEVYANLSGSLLSSDCPGVYLGGLDVHNNSFDTLIASSVHSPTVEKCRFLGSCQQWIYGLAPQTPEGDAISDGDLAAMVMGTARWKPTPAPLPAEAPQPGKDGKIHVRTMDEFLAALGSDRTIYLEKGTYALSDSCTYGSIGGSFYTWESSYDGPELIISGVKNLTIEGSGVKNTEFVTSPRYANVLRFVNCSDLTLKCFRAGHTTDRGECAGGVLDFQMCTRVNIEKCSLYGCGILGVNALSCRDMTISSTEIYECSYGAVWLSDCQNVAINRCKIHDVGPDVFGIFDGYENITVNGETLRPWYDREY